MLDHRDFLSSVPAETRDALTRRSNAPALLHLIGHLSLIIGLGCTISLGLPGWPLALPALGIALAFLFTLQHECTHKTPFRSDMLNEVVGHVIGLILIQPFHWFRAFHMAHHRHTNDPVHDPELATPKPDTLPAILWHLSSLGYWRAKLVTLFINAFGPLGASYIAPRQRRRIRLEARLLILTYALAAVFWGEALIWLWLLPLALGFPVLRLYLLAEHGHCPPVSNMFENTRTTFTNRAVRWLSWNMPYHAEHHAWPAVPYHALPALHRLSRPHLKSTSAGYSAFASNYLHTATKGPRRHRQPPEPSDPAR